MRYQARFRNTSHLYEAAAGYSAALVIDQAADRLKNTHPAEFITALVGSRYQTPIGEIYFKSSEEQGVHAILGAKVYSVGDLKLD